MKEVDIERYQEQKGLMYHLRNRGTKEWTSVFPQYLKKLLARPEKKERSFPNNKIKHSFHLPVPTYTKPLQRKPILRGRLLMKKVSMIINTCFPEKKWFDGVCWLCKTICQTRAFGVIRQSSEVYCWSQKQVFSKSFY